MTQNEQNSNTKKKCTHANHIDLYNFSYYSSVIKCRSLLAPTTFILQSNLTWLKFYSYPTITAKKAVKKKRSVYYSFSALSSQVTTDIGFLPVAFCWVLLCLFAISLAMTPTPVLFPVRMNYYWVQKLISSNSLRALRLCGSLRNSLELHYISPKSNISEINITIDWAVALFESKGDQIHNEI